MRLYVTAASHVGCVRQNNEDMVLVGDTFLRNADCTEETELEGQSRYLLALADGMGGHNSGEVASSDVLANLHFFYYDMPSGLEVGDFNEAIFEWLGSINNIIDSKGRVDSRYRDMGTTLVALAYYEGQFFWMNCGDSRIYRLHDGQLHQLSTDHSLNNLIGVAEHSNVITNCIGGGCKTSYIDMVKCSEQVQPGDTFLLCSDGLTDMVTDEELLKMLCEDANANQLCDAAIAAGGYDNVSVCVIKIV